MKKLDKTLQRAVFLRSFLLQACWNFERMQNLGFALCLEPWERRIYPQGGPHAAEFRNRQLEFFNTQPHMAGFVIGVTGRLEEEVLSGGSIERVAVVKRAMETALAGIGDALFWGTLKPLSAVLALAAGWILRGIGAPPAGAVLGSIGIYLAAFNLPALTMRWTGIRVGYEHGEAVVAEIQRAQWQRRIRWLRAAGLLLAVILAARPLLIFHKEMGFLCFYLAMLAACFGMKMFRLRALPVYGAMLAGSLFAAFVTRG